MFGRTSIAAFLALVAIGALAMAQEPKTSSGTNQITNSIGMKLTLIPSGEFMMGSNESAEETAAFFHKNYPDGYHQMFPSLFEGEHPQHRVRITRLFYLGTYHVTRGQFHQFVKETGYLTGSERGEKLPPGSPPNRHFKEENPGADGWNPDTKKLAFDRRFSWRNTGFEQTDKHPVVNVTWNDAVAFCAWLSRKEGKTYRLPTEAEWEYACRAGTTTRYYSGDDPETLAKAANIGDAAFGKTFPERISRIRSNDGYVFTAPVGQFKPNAFGLYDMHGNAWQWCADWFDEDYYRRSPVDDPTGPSDPNPDGVRVFRGGSWLDGPTFARSPAHCQEFSFNRRATVGFRVARDQ
jgi:formylglycine-generating enzyme